MAGLINFEDEKEVKQYLDNLGIEYSFQCYKEKDPEGNVPALFSRAELLQITASKQSVLDSVRRLQILSVLKWSYFRSIRYIIK